MRRIVYFMRTIMIGVALFPTSTYAKTLNELPGESVYASPTDQDAIYRIIGNSEDFIKRLDNTYGGMSVVKESITPVYWADFLEYALTGVFEIRPAVMVGGHLEENSSNKEPNYFVAKVLTPDGAYAGDIGFYVEGNIATLANISPSQQLIRRAIDKGLLPSDIYVPLGNPTVSETYYADRAEQIHISSNRDSAIPTSEVRFVSVSYLGDVFYVNDGETEFLVGLVGSLPLELSEPIWYDIFGYEPNGIAYVDDDLKAIAEKALRGNKELMAEIAAWEAAHPGERYDYHGGGGGLSLLGSTLDDGQANLKSNFGDPSTPSLGVIIGAISGSLLLVAAAAFILLRARSQAHARHNSEAASSQQKPTIIT